MEININTVEPKVERPFPKLMICPNTKTILLVVKQEDKLLHGTVLHSPQSYLPIGIYSIQWRAEGFVDFEGTIELKND